MNCHLQPSSQAAQADTPRQQLINHDLTCPRIRLQVDTPLRCWPCPLDTGGGFKSHRTPAAGRRPLTNKAGDPQ